MPEFRKKPVVIEAVRWTGYNGAEIARFLAGADWSHGPDSDPTIHTLEGNMAVGEGDWIVKGVQGEFYPCKPDIFEAIYDPVSTTEASS